jgi:transposase-like protein
MVSLRKMNDHVADLPPEYCQYEDDGCEFAESCLNCHLPVCVYDEPHGKQKIRIRRRAVEMARLNTVQGKTIKELAQIYGLSQRTIQRALNAASVDRQRKQGNEPSAISLKVTHSSNFHPSKEKECPENGNYNAAIQEIDLDIALNIDALGNQKEGEEL